MTVKNKRQRRTYETILIETDAPINLRVFAETIAKKISRGEIELDR